YRAPFLPGTEHEIDATIASRLLSVALERGGDYADLFFEYAVGSSYVFDEGILKSAGRGVSVGLGVRVMKGEATGYAYVEDLSQEAMERAARTAAQIAESGGGHPPVALAGRKLPQRYPVTSVSLDAEGTEKRALLARVDVAARAADPRVTRVD